MKHHMKRAIQSLWAKKGRSIIMIAVFFGDIDFRLGGIDDPQRRRSRNNEREKECRGDRHLIDESRGDV